MAFTETKKSCVMYVHDTTLTACDELACRCDAFTSVICNCTAQYDSVTLRPDGMYRVPPMTTSIVIDGCEQVQFLSGTVRNLPHLRSVQIRNVDNLVIQERALAWTPPNTNLENNPGIRILIQNSTVNEIAPYAIQGRVNSIVITESRINVMKPFAFSSLSGVTNVELSNNEYDNIEVQTFKNFATTNFVFRGGHINTLPSRFLSDVEVTSQFLMEGVTVRNMFSLTFRVSSPERVTIQNNNIGVLEGDAFHIVTRGPITFRNNTVISVRKGAFFGFSVHPEVTNVKGPQQLLIDNNTILDMMPSSLIFNSSLTQRVDGLNLNVSCSCVLAEEWREILSQQGGTINCWYSLEGYFISIPTYRDSRCGKFKQTFWIFVVVGILIILIIAAVGVYYIVRRENEKKKKVQIVMPDGKTYRETEFHIVVERAELLTTDL
ncbi:hypothetical protein NE865_10288 [Phthorimaea operculella]|nr:hypothetical protein NE865_10288 [Phthorimaea operculella]